MEPNSLQIADNRVERVACARIRGLVMIGYRCRPGIRHIPFQMNTAAVNVGIVPVAIHSVRVVERAPFGRGWFEIVRVQSILVGSTAEYVVDEAAVMVVVTDNPHCQFVFDQRDVEHQRTAVTRIAVCAAANFAVKNTFKGIHDRLVG